MAGARERLAAAALVVAVVASSLWAFERAWRRSPLEDLPRQPGGWWGAVAVVLVTAVVHQGFHALGWKLGGRLAWSDLVVRPSWRELGLVVCARSPMAPAAHRVGLVLPALALPLPAVVLGLAAGSGLLLAWGWFLLLECWSDFAILLARRRP